MTFSECNDCDGTGVRDQASQWPCHRCSGTGFCEDTEGDDYCDECGWRWEDCDCSETITIAEASE